MKWFKKIEIVKNKKKLKYSCMIDKIIFNWKCIFWEGKFRKGMEYECL